MYLNKKKKKQRLDHLVYILGDIVEDDSKFERRRILEHTGSMTRAQKKRRRAELEHEEVPSEENSLITQGLPGRYDILSL